MNIRDFFNFFRAEDSEEVIIKLRLGKTGSGKSLDQNEEDVLPALLDGQEVWTCYWVNWNGPNWHYFTPRDFDAIKRLRNCVVVFDELRQSFDPRSWESETEEIRSFFELHRHRHNTIIGNTQDVSLVSKTIGIQAHIWIMIERVDAIWPIRFWHALLKTKEVRIRRDYLTFQELKKISNGWELGEDVAIDADWLERGYKVKDILHRELDSYKVELVHKYCPRCKMRQGSQIIASETADWCDYDIKSGNYKLKVKEYCPRHKETLLEVRESGMYDTDYEPEVKPKKITVKAFIDSPEGYRQIPYTGNLSMKQGDEIQALGERLNHQANRV